MQQVLLSNSVVRLSRKESAAIKTENARIKIQLAERYDISVNDVLMYEARQTGKNPVSGKNSPPETRPRTIGSGSFRFFFE